MTIGDELLRGDTLDANKAFLGRELSSRGIRVAFALSVPDDLALISGWVRKLAAEYDHVLVSGGIGPTPDDMTRQAVADAFGVELELYTDAMQHFEQELGRRLNPGQQEMYRLPVGSTPIWGERVYTPGFRLENVYVFAGVPAIMESMFAHVAADFRGPEVAVEKFRALIGESRWAHVMAEFVARYPAVDIGSYPKLGERWFSEVTVRGHDAVLVSRVAAELQREIDALATDDVLNAPEGSN